MADYSKGKIYAIKSLKTDRIYIGSTTGTLDTRFADHLKPRNSCASKEITSFGDAYIELIENFPCNSRAELRKRETEVMKSTPNRVNKCAAWAPKDITRYSWPCPS
jgi:hypothetical protein